MNDFDSCSQPQLIWNIQFSPYHEFGLFTSSPHFSSLCVLGNLNYHFLKLFLFSNSLMITTRLHSNSKVCEFLSAVFYRLMS
ncbi:hypothetical protein Scep_004604 [Stephania cephalantha]|uniref:Uncharacterized protein n=1 Tax=Stephania cephalantha TaxID=152367 RepID=A0AAP0KTN8_9MAGN